jgi:hypothetical protein
MPTEFDIEVALATLDMLTAKLKSDMAKGGFNNESMMWIIKAWTKVGIRLRGSNYHREASAYYIMKRDPTPSTDKRSKTLLNALNVLETTVSRQKNSGGDFFKRADKAMLDFVWEYRRHLGNGNGNGNSEQDFVTKLNTWKSTGADQAQKAITTPIERHI